MQQQHELTREQYAERRSVTPQAISKLIRTKGIPVRKEGGRIFIDPAVADHMLGEARLRVDVDDDDDDAGPAPGAGGANFGGGGPTAGLTKARTAVEVYRAKIAELEFNERVGKLVPVEAVRDAMERCAEAIVLEINQLPAFADDLAAAIARGGVAAARDALKLRARQLRDRLEKTMTLLAESEAEEAAQAAA